jgi:uncharacterized protein (DUF2141 family)
LEPLGIADFVRQIESKIGRKLPKTVEKRGSAFERGGQNRGSAPLVLLVCLSILILIGVSFYGESALTTSPAEKESRSRPLSSQNAIGSSEELAIASNLQALSPRVGADPRLELGPIPIDPSKAETTLIVEVVGFRSEQGECLVAIYDSSASFNKIDQSILRQSKSIDGKDARFEFAVLGNKPVAIAAFHDENRNGQLDKNAFGIPTERYGFSNNPPSTFGPPSFSAAAVQDPKKANEPIKILLDGLKLTGSN